MGIVVMLASFAMLVAAFSAAALCQRECAQEGCATAGVSLIQQKRKLTKLASLGEIAANFTVSAQHDAKFEDLVGGVEGLAVKNAQGNWTISNGEKEVLGIVKNMIADRTIEFDEVYKTSQKNVNAAKKAIENCTNATKADLLVVATREAKMNSSRVHHSACRDKEVAECDTKAKECKAWDTMRKNTEPPVCLKLMKNGQLHGLRTDTPSIKSEMEKCVREAASHFAGLKEALAKCDNETGDCENQSKLCKTQQDTFEVNFCAYAAKLEDACRQQDVCRATTISLRDNIHANAKVTELAIRHEFLAGQKILCFMKVFTAPTQDKKKTLHGCQTLSESATNYSIVYHAIPTPSSCNKPATQVCDATWLAQEYKAQHWYSKVQMEQCKPCTPPTTTTTPATTTTTKTTTTLPQKVSAFMVATNRHLHRCVSDGMGTWDCKQKWQAGGKHDELGPIAIAKDGNYLVGIQNHRGGIFKCLASGGNGEKCTTWRKHVIVKALMVASNGDLIFSSGHTVQRCADGSGSTPCTTVVRGFQSIQGVALTATGDYVVANLYCAGTPTMICVQLCPSDGTGTCTTKNSKGTCTRVAGQKTRIGNPYGVAVADNGDYIIADSGSSIVFRCPASGSGDCNRVGLAASHPRRLDVDPNQDVWVTITHMFGGGSQVRRCRKGEETKRYCENVKMINIDGRDPGHGVKVLLGN